MSLYNELFGYSSPCLWFLPMLGKTPTSYPRFRDCFIGHEKYPEKYDGCILIYCRIGGGNREYHAEDIEELRNLPGYIEDFDDEFDKTYAFFVYKCPEEFIEDYEKLNKGDNINISKAYKTRIFDIYPYQGLLDKIKDIWEDEDFSIINKLIEKRSKEDEIDTLSKEIDTINKEIDELLEKEDERIEILRKN